MNIDIIKEISINLKVRERSGRYSYSSFFVYGRSLKDDTSYPDKMIHLTAIRCYIFRRKLVYAYLFGFHACDEVRNLSTFSGGFV